MNASTTVVFADLTGSTGVFEALGNELATKAITTLTQSIAVVVGSHGGRVVKMLGDGVLSVFETSGEALQAAVAMHKDHSQRIRDWPDPARMKLQVGVAAGEVVVVEGDCFGDAVNVSSRLSDLSGPDQILANRSAIDEAGAAGASLRMRSLGPVQVRGRTAPVEVFRVEWEDDIPTMQFTQPAPLGFTTAPAEPKDLTVALSWLDQQATFRRDQLPVALGRVDAGFVVNDPRVSRVHARILVRGTGLVLEDLSSYGTWLRFEGSPAEICLRREECMLHTGGEIALGAPFDDFTAPVVVLRIGAM